MYHSEGFCYVFPPAVHSLTILDNPEAIQLAIRDIYLDPYISLLNPGFCDVLHHICHSCEVSLTAAGHGVIFLE